MSSIVALGSGVLQQSAQQRVFLFDPKLGVTLQQARSVADSSKSELPAEIPGLLIFDAVTSEEHGGNSTITSHPVESGADISDHSRPEARTVTLTGIVSDTPIIPLFTGGLATTRSKDARDIVEKWRKSGTALTLSTSLEVYENMMIESVATPRGPSLSRAVQMAISMREVFTATTLTVAAPRTTSTRGQQGKAAQSKAKKVEATDSGSAQEATLAQSLWNAVR